MEFLKCSPKWTREPKKYVIQDGKVVITTEKGTDLWARTYYGFQNDNAPVLQIRTEEQYFSFIVKTEFDRDKRFDQCGIAMYLDSDNWFKASIEYEDEKSKGWAVWLQTMDIPTGQPPIFRLKSKVCGIVFPAGEVTIVSNAARMELILNK